MIMLLALLALPPLGHAALPPEVQAMAEAPLSGPARLALARSLLGRTGWEEAGIEALVRLIPDPEVGTAARAAVVELLARVDARPGWEAIYAELLKAPSFSGRELVALRYAEVRLANASTSKSAGAELDRLLLSSDPAIARLIGRVWLRAGEGDRARRAFARAPEAAEMEALAALAAGDLRHVAALAASFPVSADIVAAAADGSPFARAEVLATRGFARAGARVLRAAPAAVVGFRLAEFQRADGALPEATISLQAFLKANPADSAARIALVDVLVSRQRYGAALELLRAGETEQRARLTTLDAYRRRWEAKDKRGLEVLLRDAWRVAPNDSFIAREWAKSRVADRHPEEALPILGQLLTTDPADADALGVYNLAAISTKTSRSAVQRNLAAAAVARSPKERAERLATASDLMTLDGEEVKANGNVDGAIDAYLVSLLVAPPSVSDLLGAAGLLWQSQNLGGATALFEEVTRRQPGNVDALLSAVRLHLQSDNEGEALRLLESTSIRDSRVRLMHVTVVNAVRTREARAAGKAGDLEVALVLWRELAEQYPKEPEFLHGLGDVLAGLGDHAAALEQYERAVELDPDDAWAVIGQANALVALGRPEDARTRLSERYPAGRDAVADEELPRVRARAWRATAGREAAAGATLEAFKAYKAAFELDPEVWSITGLGALYQLRDQPEVALAFYDEAHSLDPALEEAHLGRALALEALGRWDDTLAATDELKAREPSEYTRVRRSEIVRRVAVQRAEFLRRSGDAANAVAQLRAVLEAEGESADLHFAIASSALDVSDCQTALASIEAGLKLNPRSRWGLRTTVRTGAACKAAEATERVLAEADRVAGAGFAAAELRSAAFEVQVQRAESLVAQSRVAEAEYALARAAKFPSMTADEHARLGGAWLGLGDARAAISSFDAAQVEDPGHVSAIIGKGGALRALGRLSEAERYLTESWSRVRDPRVGLQLVQLLIQRGRYSKAARVLDEVRPSTIPPEAAPAPAERPEPLPVLALPSGREVGPRTWPPEVPRDAQPRWLALQLAAIDVSLARETSGSVNVGGGVFSKQGVAGEQQLSGWYVPVEAVFPPIGLLRVSADAVVLGLNDGVDEAVGVAPSVAIASAPFRRFFASARVGTSPIGFDDTNVVWHGHARWGLLPNLAIGGQTARTPVSDSLLSWAGKTRQVGDAEVYHGLVSNIWFGGYAAWTPAPSSLGALVRGGYTEGYGVEVNPYIEGVAWADTRIGGSTSGLRGGVNVVAMHHERQEDGFSPGDGGYFSPPVFLLAMAELKQRSEFSGGRGAVCASVGAGPQYLDGSPTPWFGVGVSGSGRLTAGASWRLAPTWAVGVDGRLQGSLSLDEGGNPSTWHQEAVLAHVTWGLTPHGTPAPSHTTMASNGSILPEASTLCSAR